MRDRRGLGGSVCSRQDGGGDVLSLEHRYQGGRIRVVRGCRCIYWFLSDNKLPDERKDNELLKLFERLKSRC